MSKFGMKQAIIVVGGCALIGGVIGFVKGFGKDKEEPKEEVLKASVTDELKEEQEIIE